MFKRLKKEVVRYYNNERQEWAFGIKNGYFKKWVSLELEETLKKSDVYLLRNLTPSKLKAYKGGKLKRTEAVKIAIARKWKELEKAQAEKIAKIEQVEQAEELKYISINIEWHKSATWGNNPKCVAFANGYYGGTASGCGYDKESASMSQALNQSKSILKELYKAEEKRLAITKSKRPSRRDFIGYGSGYGVLPYLEGGVGACCHISIFNKLGFKSTEAHGKTWDYYELRK